MGSDKIKICYLVSSLCNEGPVNVMYNIIKHLDHSLFEISIVTLIPEKQNTRINDFKVLPVSIYQLAKDKKLTVLGLYLKLRKQISQLNPDILHSHCPRSLYLKCFIHGPYKKVYTIHNYPGKFQKILYGKFKGHLVMLLNHFFMKKMDSLIACSDNLSKMYSEKFNKTILSAPNGCSFPVFEDQSTRLNKQTKLREQLGLDNNLKYFISIGRFSPEKNMEKIAEAFVRLNADNTGLILLGDGLLYPDLKKKYGDKIIFPGFCTNVYDYLIASDYYISASDGEGMPNTLLESMTVGLPVVLSDIPSHREVLEKTNGNVGFIFDQTSVEDITFKMRQILSIDEEIAANGLRSVFSHYYTSEIMSKSYQTAYLSLSLNKKQ